MLNTKLGAVCDMANTPRGLKSECPEKLSFLKISLLFTVIAFDFELFKAQHDVVSPYCSIKVSLVFLKNASLHIFSALIIICVEKTQKK